jgi:hypothetical protein
LVLGAVTVSLAGCFSSGTDEFDPGSHVPDKWHEIPKIGLSEPIEQTTSTKSVNNERNCEDVAIQIVTEHVHSSIEDTTNINPVSCCIEIDGKQSIVVNRRIEVDRDGNMVSSPNIEFKEVRHATPERIRLVLESETGEQTCRFPVFVKDTVVHIA